MHPVIVQYSLSLVPVTTKADDLRPAFEPYGEITEVHVLYKYGEHRGCAFVSYLDPTHAEAAMNALGGVYTLPGVCVSSTSTCFQL